MDEPKPSPRHRPETTPQGELPLVSHSPAPPPGDPAAAFAALAQEVALLRHAFAEASTEKLNPDIPDYSPTLGAMDAHLRALAASLKAMTQRPALQLGPEEFSQAIERAAYHARRSDAAGLHEAQDGFTRAASDLRAQVNALHIHGTRRREQVRAAIGGAMAGCLLWSFLPGTLARALPASWHLPERMAAHTIGEPTYWAAGMRLMEAESASAVERIDQAIALQRANQGAIDACRQKARKRQQTIACTVMVGAS